MNVHPKELQHQTCLKLPRFFVGGITPAVQLPPQYTYFKETQIFLQFFNSSDNAFWPIVNTDSLESILSRTKAPSLKRN